MCVGKNLNFPDVLPAFKVHKQFNHIESHYTKKNLEKAAIKEKLAMTSAFSTINGSQEDNTTN
jgi:hypothetical protein